MSAVATYRVYAIEEDIIVRARFVEARTDEEALIVAAEIGWARWQLWQGTRLLGSSDAIARNPS
jgi:hypothetical protein